MRYNYRTKMKIAAMICMTAVFMLSGRFDIFSFAMKNASTEESKVSEQKAETEKEQRYIIKYKNMEKGKQDLKKRNKKVGKTFKNVPYVTTELSATEYEELRKDKNIEFIEKDHPIEVLTQPELSNQDLYTENIKKVGALEAHSEGVQGDDIKVAVLDTGIDQESPELQTAGGVSFVPEEPDYDDQNGHGTAVAGIIAAVKDSKGLVGIAPDVDLYAVKVLNTEGSGTYSQVIQGIDWAIEHNMNILSMSLGGQSDSLALKQAVSTAASQGLLIVAAAGNSGGQDTLLYPARYPEVLSVGAINGANQRASFSSAGSELDLVAPGVNIRTTGLNGEEAAHSGTSMAAPHVTGAAAALWSSDSALSSQALKQKLLDTAVPLGAVNEYGMGMVHLAKALGLSEVTDVEAPDKTDKEIYDTEVLDMGKQLISLRDYAIQADHIELAKQIDNDYNSLLIAQNELTAEMEIAESKDAEAQSTAAKDFFDTHMTEFNKLKSVYQEALSQYRSELPDYEEQESDSLNVQSTQLILNTPIDVSLAAGATEVYSFTPAVTTIYKIYTGPYGGSGTSNDTVLELYSDVNLTTLIASNDDANSTYFSEIKPTLTANTTYYVKLRHYSSSGAVHARLTAEVNQAALTINAPIDVDLPVGGSQIFKYTPTSTGSYKIYTTYYNGSSSSGSNDTVVHVYSDVNLTTQIGYNDDSNGTTFSQLKMNMTAGKVFYIKLRGFGNGSVHARISVVYEPQSFQSISANNPVDVTVGQNQYTAYSFTPTVTGSYRIFTGPYGTTGGASDTMLYLYGSSSMTSTLASNDDSNGTLFSEIHYTLTAGTTYYIRLTGYAGRSISTRFTISQPNHIYVYDDAGRLDYITLSTGGTMDYQYDANGNLKKKVFQP